MGDHSSSQSTDLYPTYTAYLDSQITATDLYYLESPSLARQLVELGYRGSGDTLKREEFEMRKKLERGNKESTSKSTSSNNNKTVKSLYSSNVDLKNNPLLIALANRESQIQTGKLTSIIYIRSHNKKGQEISGYIDYAHRLRSEDFSVYFDGSKALLPAKTDLSYFNFETQVSTSNSTSNFSVISDSDNGLLFKNKRDRKVVNVDPKGKPGDNTTRTEIDVSSLGRGGGSGYEQVVIFDHLTRRKS